MKSYLMGDDPDYMDFMNKGQVPQYDYAQKSGAADLAGPASAGASGAMAGGVPGALIGLGGGFLSQYLAQRAQEEENKKKAMLEAAQTQGQGETNALNTMLQGWRGALR